MAIRKTNLFKELTAFNHLKDKQQCIERFKTAIGLASENEIIVLIDTLNWLNNNNLIDVGVFLLSQPYPKDKLLMIHHYLIGEENVRDLLDMNEFKNYPIIYKELDVYTFVMCLLEGVDKEIMMLNNNKKCFYIATYWPCIKRNKKLLDLAKDPKVKKTTLAKELNFICR